MHLRTLVFAVALLAPRASTQEPWSVELVLAADPDRRGPPAWVWLRDELLPDLDGWPESRYGRRATRLTLHGPALHVTDVGDVGGSPLDDAGGTYLHGVATLPGLGTARGGCGFDGVACWQLEPEPHPTATWPSDLGVDRAESLQSYDVGSVIGLLSIGSPSGGGTPHHDPTGPFVAIASTECGELDVCWTARSTGDVELRARSGGGLLLPVLLATLAAGPDDPDTSAAELRSLILRASCMRGDDRLEAARQLVRYGDDPRARHALTRALLGDARLAETAIASLARAGDAGSLRWVVAAAATASREPHADPALVSRAVWDLWPRIGRGTDRDDVRDALRASAVPELRALIGRLDDRDASREHDRLRTGARRRSHPQAGDEPPNGLAILRTALLALIGASWIAIGAISARRS